MSKKMLSRPSSIADGSFGAAHDPVPPAHRTFEPTDDEPEPLDLHDPCGRNGEPKPLTDIFKK